MDPTPLYHILHKTIRNLVPGKGRQRAAIEALRSAFFPLLLEDVRISPEDAVQDGTAQKNILRSGLPLPPVATICEDTPPPDMCCAEIHTHAPVEYLLEGGYAFRNFVLDRNLRFLADPADANLYETNLYRANKNIRSLRPLYVNADVIALNTTWTDNFYHWFADLIGHLLLLPAWENKAVCADVRYPYQRETFQLLGIGPERIFALSDYRLYRFKSLSLISVPRLWPDPHSLTALRALSGRVPTLPGERNLPRRLYISRGDRPDRRALDNEGELLPIFAEYGFTRVIFSAYPLEEQIRMARNADFLVIPHGAAGINLVFCPSGVRFLEIMSPLAPDGSSLCICQSFGIDYHLLRGGGGDEVSAAGSNQVSYSVDPQALRRALGRLTG
jgi:hypothetical protein